MRNDNVATRFFNEPNTTFDKSYMTVSYQDNKYYSYSTVIAQITQTIDNKTACIISYQTFSNTTAKHIGQLKYACPHKIYHLPQKYNAKEFQPLIIFHDLKDWLEHYGNSKLTQKPNRQGFIDCYEMLKGTLDLIMFEPMFEQIKDVLDSYNDLYVQLINWRK